MNPPEHDAITVRTTSCNRHGGTVEACIDGSMAEYRARARVDALPHPGGIGIGHASHAAQRTARLACRERCEFIPSLDDASRVAVDRAKALAKDCRLTFGP